MWIGCLLLLAGNLDFKFRTVIWNILFWRFEKHIALSEEKQPLAKWTKIIFDLKIMVKSGIVFLFRNSTSPFRDTYLLTCQANSAFLVRFFCTGQKQQSCFCNLLTFIEMYFSHSNTFFSWNFLCTMHWLPEKWDGYKTRSALRKVM